MDEESDEKIESFHIGNSSRTQEHLRLSVDNEHLKFDSTLSESQNVKIDFSKCKSTCKSVRIFPGLSQEPRLCGLKREEKEGEKEREEDAAESRFRSLVVNNSKNNTKIINNRNRGDQINSVIHLNRSEKGKREKREPKNEILSRTMSLFNIRYLSRILFYLIFVWLILNAQLGGVESVSVMKTRATALINLNKELTNNNRTLRIRGSGGGIGVGGDSDRGKEVPEPTGETGGDQWLDKRLRKHHHQHHRSHHHNHRHHKDQHQEQEQERQQKRDRKQDKKPVNKNCKEYDVTSRAFLSDVVFEGTARSRSRRAPGHYVTFVVKRVLKQKNNLLKPKTQIRLLFGGRRHSKRLSRINPLHDCPLNSISNGHRAMANLKVGDNYYVFADQIGLMNYTARGDPIVVNRRNLKSIRSVLSNKKERPPRVVGLKDLNLKVTQSLRLSCQVRGRPVPRINWYKDGALLIPSPQVNVTYYRRNSTVDINSLELKDGGLYECRATSVTGKSAKISAHINVWKLYTPTADPGKSFPITKCSVDEYCLNGGQCYFIEHVGEHLCECKVGYTGARCEVKEVSSRGIKSYVCGFNVGYSSYYC